VRGLGIALRLAAANLEALPKEMNFTLKTVDLTLNPQTAVSKGILSSMTAEPEITVVNQPFRSSRVLSVSRSEKAWKRRNR
jgi:hypothetical protein